MDKLHNIYKYTQYKLYMISKHKIMIMIMSLLMTLSGVFADNITNTSNTTINNEDIQSNINQDSILYIDLNNTTNIIFILLMLLIVGFLLVKGLTALAGLIGLVIGLMLLFNGLNILISLFIVFISTIFIFK